MAKQVEMKQMKIERIKVKIVGDSPMIQHTWSEKSKKNMLDKQMKKVVQKEAKNPEEQYEGSIHRMDDGSVGFPVTGIKECAVRGGKSLGVVMTDARGAFFIHGIYSKKDGQELTKIIGTPSMREDMVKLETGVADIRYRPEIFPWSAVLEISYNSSVISAEQIVNMLNMGGYGVGLGEWRPEKKGTFGRFHVEGK